MGRGCLNLSKRQSHRVGQPALQKIAVLTDVRLVRAQVVGLFDGLSNSQPSYIVVEAQQPPRNSIIVSVANRRIE
jgi:hypothetical protein